MVTDLVHTTAAYVSNKVSQETQNICITFIQRRPNVFDVGPTLYKCNRNVLCLPGKLIVLRNMSSLFIFIFFK